MTYSYSSDIIMFAPFAKFMLFSLLNIRRNVEISDNYDNLSQIEGILWEANGDIAIVFSHGAIYDAKSWENQELELLDDNISSFAVEDISVDQVIAAGKLLKVEKDLNKIILIGASAGGASAIKAVNQEPSLFDKIILLSPAGNPTSIEEIPLLSISSSPFSIIKSKLDNSFRYKLKLCLVDFLVRHLEVLLLHTL